MGTQGLIEILKEIIIADDYGGELNDPDKNVEAAEPTAADQERVAKRKTPLTH